LGLRDREAKTEGQGLGKGLPRNAFGDVECGDTSMNIRGQGIQQHKVMQGYDVRTNLDFGFLLNLWLISQSLLSFGQ